MATNETEKVIGSINGYKPMTTANADTLKSISKMTSSANNGDFVKVGPSGALTSETIGSASNTTKGFMTAGHVTSLESVVSDVDEINQTYDADVMTELSTARSTTNSGNYLKIDTDGSITTQHQSSLLETARFTMTLL